MQWIRLKVLLNICTSKVIIDDLKFENKWLQFSPQEKQKLVNYYLEGLLYKYYKIV